MTTTAKDIIKRIEEEEIEWVDLRFTDPKGKWQHLQMCSGVMDEDALEDGLMFDGSSIAGWKAINESDMILRPDLDAVYEDPFSATPMLAVCCDIVEPGTGLSALAIPAAQQCLEKAGVAAAELDGIIVATVSGDYLIPATANLVQAAIGAEKAFAYDITNACNGFVTALSSATALAWASKAREPYQALRYTGALKARSSAPWLPLKPAFALAAWSAGASGAGEAATRRRC